MFKWKGAWLSLLMVDRNQHFPESFLGGSDGKESAFSAGEPGSIPGSGISPGEGNGNPLQYSCLRIPWIETPGKPWSMGSQRVGHN